MKNFHKLKIFEESQINEIYKTITTEIKANKKYQRKLEYFQKLYNTYLKYSIEKNFKLFTEYVNQLSTLISTKDEELIKEFSDFEKISFNCDCIPDESLLILQVLSLK